MGAIDAGYARDMTLQAHVKDRVLAHRDEVFEAIVDPAKLARFFISDATDSLREGRTVTWTFADVDMTLDVNVKEVHRPDRIAFSWGASGKDTDVDIVLADEGDDRTLVDITEDGWLMDNAGVQQALGQTRGWTDFLCSMKAYLQHGVNLREGRTASAVH